MARLLGSHPLDCVRICSCCFELSEVRYDGSQILVDELDRIVESRLFTCQECHSTFAADHEPRPDATDDNVMLVTDLRAWERKRRALLEEVA